ncbi:MAG TPA: iron-sulfur cluster biosynthesis protein [Pseudonocardiaceae bacterium]|jgi:Fe-S cluster assembly iron-binding protein IscA|nr:iron-sulfur cluster biosynthesis protein [Pseudonocardiaceae bacterium]
MLTLTPAAIEVVSTMAEASGMPDTAGLRIANSTDPAGLEVAFVSGPAEQDQVLNEGGARVFLENQAAQYLTDKVLTGEFDEEGQVHFSVAPQA